MDHSVWIGYDARESAAFAVCRDSIKLRTLQPIPIRALVLSRLRRCGLYYREHTYTKNGQLFDLISQAPMSTEFAISRFLTPTCAGEGLALFMDCDIVATASLMPIFEKAERQKHRFAVWVVKHQHNPEYGVKMDGQVQTRYARKNWSSVVLFNCDHPSNKALTPELVNELPGRDLHGFCWLKDDEIGELDPRYNYLVGHTKLEPGVEPVLIHFTDGIPTMRGYEECEYGKLFEALLENWADPA